MLRRVCQFGWRVDLGCIRQLYDEVAAAGSRDSRILRSPAHSFGGYEVRREGGALQLPTGAAEMSVGLLSSALWLPDVQLL